MSISIRRISNISRINLTPEQEIQSQKKIEEIIAYTEILNSANKVDKDFNINIYKNINTFRDDINKNFDLETNSIIKKNSPEFLENLFVVPLLVKREK